MKYEHRESFMHKHAKDVLVNRLVQIEKENDYCEFHGLKWRKNYGVFTELKFYETSDTYYFETSGGLLPYNEKRSKNPLEWFDVNFNRGNILFVPDITIFHKGTPTIFIEVVHSHHTEQPKLNAIEKFFAGCLIQVYEVSAKQILENTTPELKRCDFIEAFVSV